MAIAMMKNGAKGDDFEGKNGKKATISACFWAVFQVCSIASLLFATPLDHFKGGGGGLLADLRTFTIPDMVETTEICIGKVVMIQVCAFEG